MAARRTAPMSRSACRCSTATTLLGFSVTTAHHLDIGAHTPGSCGIVDAVDAYAEGLQFKAIKVVDQGRRNDAVWHMVRDNIRIPDLVVGDMKAQIAAAQIGAQRYLDLVHRYGRATVRGACEDLMDYSERMMRKAIGDIPDGVYAAETFIDGYLDDPDPARRDLKFAVAITVRGDELTVDLTGTSPQVSDRPINLPFEGTVDCAIWLTLRSILLDTAVYGKIPQNERHHPADHHRRAQGHARQSDFSSAGDRAVFSRQPACRHGDEGARTGGAASGQCRHRQFARDRFQRNRQGTALGAHGDF